MDFAEVVEHLRLIAKSIAGADSPQPEIAVIDVSSCAPAKHRAKKQSGVKTRRRPAAKRSRPRTRGNARTVKARSCCKQV
jgi:hypothetical protein